eukprot:scaffold17154_cov116-Cyclotella_meneghiniana.AAC.1
MRVDLITISYCSLPVYLKSLSSTKTCVIDVDNDDISDQRHYCRPSSVATVSEDTILVATTMPLQ